MYCCQDVSLLLKGICQKYPSRTLMGLKQSCHVSRCNHNNLWSHDPLQLKHIVGYMEKRSYHQLLLWYVRLCVCLCLCGRTHACLCMHMVVVDLQSVLLIGMALALVRVVETNLIRVSQHCISHCFHFDSHLRQLYTSNKTDCFCNKGGFGVCGRHTHIKVFKRIAGLDYT